MFIARSTARVRRARLLFLAVGFVPTVALVAWAGCLRSDAHRASVESRWQETLGLPLVIGRIERPRPGVIRAHDCMLPPMGTRPAVAMPLIELESSADEDRIRIPSLTSDAAVAAVAFDLAGRWLDDDIRFRRACVVEIDHLSCGDASRRDESPPGTPSSPLRIECVLHDSSRAIRVVRRGDQTDEVRVVRHPAAAPGAVPTYEVDATLTTPIPVAILAALPGSGSSRLASVGHEATVHGGLQASWDEGGWHGEGRGKITGIDLAAAATAVGDRAAGVADVEISRLVVQGGRVRDALVEATVTAGYIDRRLFDRIVLALAARPGEAAARVPPTEPLAFDAAAFIVAIGPYGVSVQPSARLPGGLATSRGEILLAPPAGAVTADRIAWLLSSPGTTFGPTAGPGAWLMSVLPPLVPQTAPTEGERRF